MFGFWIILSVLLASGPAAAENRIALVIGNNHYPNLDPDRQLQKAANDAAAVGDALQRDGFTVLRGTDLTRAEMVDKLYEMSALLHPGDTALFYFAGHGVALGNGNYLIPTDVPDIDEGQEMRLANQSVAESDVIATLQDKGARVSIMIFDACRDNPFRRPGLRSIGMERGLGRMPDANGVFSLYSAGYGQSALDRLSANDPNPNSVFTRVLVPLLTQPRLNLDDLAFEVRQRVAKLAASTPDHFVQTPAAYDQIVGGRVYLSPVGENDVSLSDPSLEERIVTLAIEAELNRLGCNAGPASADWNSQSKNALLRYGQAKNVILNIDHPDQSVLSLLQAEPGSPCQIEPRVNPGPARVIASKIDSSPMATSDREAYESISDSSNLDELLRFTERYPKSDFEPDVRARIKTIELEHTVARLSDQSKKTETVVKSAVQTASPPGSTKESADTGGGKPVVGRAAILIDAPDLAEKVRTYVGTVIWQTETGSYAQHVGAARALVSIPGVAELDMQIWPNSDPQMPATHLIDLAFTIPVNGPLGNVRQINVPQMRNQDMPTGDRLGGTPVTVSDNHFLVGLADGTANVKNMALIKERGWFDIPMLTETGKASKITFEKDPGGTGIVQTALVSRDQSGSSTLR